jgi:hypothetical protein
MSSYNNYKPSGKRFNQEQQPRDQPRNYNARDQDQGYSKRYDQPRDQGRPYGEKSSNYGGDSYQGKSYNNDNRNRQQEGGGYQQRQQYNDDGYGYNNRNRNDRPAYSDN